MSNGVASQTNSERSTLGLYVTGYLLSICLTLLAYAVVRSGFSTRDVVIGIITLLAVAQFVTQLYFFLHLNGKSRWKMGVFFLMLLVVGILVIGSLWIMSNLNYRMMPSESQMNNYMQSQDVL
jgi:cytochrome o ubiquinol oxidase subunit IV